jgi:hypothetical protein
LGVGVISFEEIKDGQKLNRRKKNAIRIFAIVMYICMREVQPNGR